MFNVQNTLCDFPFWSQQPFVYLIIQMYFIIMSSFSTTCITYIIVCLKIINFDGVDFSVWSAKVVW